MTDSEYNAQVRWMRNNRTLTQDQVDERTREHDAHDLKPTERLAQFGV